MYVQIGVAHIQIALGIFLSFAYRPFYIWHTYIVFWEPAILIWSGFLAVGAHGNVSTKLIRMCNIFHTISIFIIVTGIVLAGMDAYMLYSCDLLCGSVESIAIVTLFLFTNMVQLFVSGYVVYYGYRSLNSVEEIPIQTRGNTNLGFAPPNLPTYSEPTFHGPPPFTQSPELPQPPEFTQTPEFPPPPPYLKVLPTSPPPEFSEVVDCSQPPPYSA